MVNCKHLTEYFDVEICYVLCRDFSRGRKEAFCPLEIILPHELGFSNELVLSQLLSTVI